jgi:NADPH:quinone reductase
MAGASRMVLWSSILPAVRHGRRVYCCTCRSGCPLPQHVSADQGACLGIPDITAHRAVHVAGPVSGRTVLVQGAAGSVGLCAVQLARQAGARVIGTIRSTAEEETARNAGAHELVRNDKTQEFIARVKELAPNRIDHIVEVAFGANIEADLELLNLGGSVASYATNVDKPAIPFCRWCSRIYEYFFWGVTTFRKRQKWQRQGT